MFRAIRVSRLVAETLGAIPGSEIEPTARHVCPLRQQLAAKCVPRCDLAMRVANGNMLRDGLTVVRVVAGVAGNDRSVLQEGRIAFPHQSVLAVVSFHVTPPSGRC